MLDGTVYYVEDARWKDDLKSMQHWSTELLEVELYGRNPETHKYIQYFHKRKKAPYSTALDLFCIKVNVVSHQKCNHPAFRYAFAYLP